MRLPLSIRTPSDNPYGDELGSDGFLQYRYQGEDPNRHDNVWLRTCMREGTPLVYLHGLGGANYQPLWPVYIHGDAPAWGEPQGVAGAGLSTEPRGLDVLCRFLDAGGGRLQRRQGRILDRAARGVC